jgi:single-strand DNA-binding protein
MNIVTLIGNLTKDTELRYTKENKPVASFTIAINRINDGVDYIPIKVFNKQAENCNKYLKKGSKVAIDGTIRTGSYEKDGKRYYTTEIIANRVMFLSNSINNQEKEKQVENGAKNKSEGQTNENIYAEFGDSVEITDDMIAF